MCAGRLFRRKLTIPSVHVTGRADAIGAFLVARKLPGHRVAPGVQHMDVSGVGSWPPIRPAVAKMVMASSIPSAAVAASGTM